MAFEDVAELVATSADPLDEFVALERMRVWKASDRLPEQQRAAMRLRFSEDLTMEDVGAVLGKSPAAAKLLIYRAVRRLRRELRSTPRDDGSGVGGLTQAGRDEHNDSTQSSRLEGERLDHWKRQLTG